MRNPLNAIRLQVNEMDSLTKDLELRINQLKNSNLNVQKYQLVSLIDKLKQSMNIQLSSEGILSSLVNDILDYA